MNIECLRHGHQWKQVYPEFESEWVNDPLKIWVCERCGKQKSEGPHKKMNSELTGRVHDRHIEMVIESAEQHGI